VLIEDLMRLGNGVYRIVCKSSDVYAYAEISNGIPVAFAARIGPSSSDSVNARYFLARVLSRLRRVRRSLASRSPELVRVLEAIGVLKEDSDGYIVADRRLARAIASLAKAIGRYRRAMTSQE